MTVVWVSGIEIVTGEFSVDSAGALGADAIEETVGCDGADSNGDAAEGAKVSGDLVSQGVDVEPPWPAPPAWPPPIPPP